PHGERAGGGLLDPAHVRVRGARLPGERGLHGSRQLGHRSRRRRALRLPARVGAADEQSHGGAAPDAVRAPRRRDREGPRPGVPGFLPALTRDPTVAAVRGRDHRVRPRRGAGGGDRAQAPVPHPALLRRDDHGARRAAVARALAARHAPARGAARHVGPRDRLGWAGALNCSSFVCAAMLVFAGSVFCSSGHQDVARLEDAHRLLAPLLGTGLASTVFAVALLCSGQSSTITGTLAGQIVMEGFLRIRIRPWLRRLISRGLAIIPAAFFIVARGERAVDELLVLSQVILSLQLSFAVVPLILFTSDRKLMGEFANKPWVIALAVLTAAIIVGLNANLVAQQLGGWLAAAGSNAIWIGLLVLPVVAGMALLLGYITLAPLFKRIAPALAWRAPAAPLAPSAPRRA